MRKEQLLSRLKEMLDNLKRDKDFKLSQENNEKELASIHSQKEILNYQIQELRAKLENDDNYQDFSYMKNQAKIYDYNHRIDKINEEIAQNEVYKTNTDNRILAVTKEIEASKALLSEEQKNLDRLGAELRKLGNNPSPEEDKAILDKIAESRAGIQFVKKELESYNEELKDLQTNKKQIAQRLDTLANSKKIDEELLKDILEFEKNKKDTIDHEKKQRDQEKLSQLQATLKAATKREEYISYDFPLALDALIYAVEKDGITEEQILEELKEMKANMPKQIANKDYVSVVEELEDNRRMQGNITKEKEELEQRLKNNDNYLPSIFAIEVMNQEINELESNVAKYDANIQSIDATIINYENSKKDYEIKIEQEENKKEPLNSQLYDLRLKQIVLPTEVYEAQKDEINQEKKRIQKQINEIDKRIEKFTKSSLSFDLLITLAKKERKNLESLKNYELKLLDSKTKSLDERTSVDKSLMNRDKEKLESLNAQLSILKMRENDLYYDYEVELDEIMSRIKNSKKSYSGAKNNEPAITIGGLEGMNVVVEEPTKDLKQKKDDSIVTPLPAVPVVELPDELSQKSNDDIITPIVPVGELPNELSQKSDDDIITPIVPIVDSNSELAKSSLDGIDPDENLSEEPVVVEGDNEKEDEKDNTPVPIVLWKKAKKSVLEKLRDKEFWKKVKIGLIVAGGLAIGLLLSRCGDEKVVTPTVEEVATVETATPEPSTPETATPETAEEPEIEEEPEAPKKSIEELAWEVIHGDWGNGEERRDRLTEAGYDYEAVQDKVNEILSHMKKPSTGGNTNTGSTGGGTVVNPTPETPVVTNPDVTYPDIIFPNPDYPDPITPDEIPDPELPDPIYPEPDSDPVLDSVEVTVQPGDTFVMDTPDGSVAVDNSNLENSDVAGDVNYDYTTSDSIDSVTFDDSTGSVEVTVNPEEVFAPQDNMTEEKQEDYDAILAEMGISEGGKTR